MPDFSHNEQGASPRALARPGHKTFAGLVADMAEGLQIDLQRRFAIAIERTTTRIENGTQEVLDIT